MLSIKKLMLSESFKGLFRELSQTNASVANGKRTEERKSPHDIVRTL